MEKTKAEKELQRKTVYRHANSFKMWSDGSFQKYRSLHTASLLIRSLIGYIDGHQILNTASSFPIDPDGTGIC